MLRGRRGKPSWADGWDPMKHVHALRARVALALVIESIFRKLFSSSFLRNEPVSMLGSLTNIRDRDLFPTPCQCTYPSLPRLAGFLLLLEILDYSRLSGLSSYRVVENTGSIVHLGMRYKVAIQNQSSISQSGPLTDDEELVTNQLTQLTPFSFHIPELI